MKGKRRSSLKSSKGPAKQGVKKRLSAKSRPGKRWKARKPSIPSRRRSLYDQGYDRGYDDGTTRAKEELRGSEGHGYAEGEHAGYGKGYADGRHAGGDGIVDAMLPEYEVLPETTMEEIISAGIAALRPRYLHLLNPVEVGDRILQALAEKRPYSMVRLGDGELLTLAQDAVIPADQVKAEGAFLEYAGVHVPDLEARNRLVEAVRHADVVGIPRLRLKHFQPLAFAVFRANDMNYREMHLTDSLMNYYLHQAGYLPRFSEGRRVLLVGNLAPVLSERLQGAGVHVAGAIAPVNGVRDTGRVMEHVRQHDFDLAYVAAGIPAVILCQRIASELGKVALDFGHLANSLAKGEVSYT